MAQIIKKIAVVEFNDEISRQEYFEKHKHQFDFAQFKTLDLYDQKFYDIIWYDREDRELSPQESTERISDLCALIQTDNIKKPAPLGTETIGGFFK